MAKKKPHIPGVQFVALEDVPTDVAKLDDLTLLRIQKYSDFTDIEWYYSLAFAAKKGADPLAGQIIFLKRPDPADHRKHVISFILTVEMFRLIADRAGNRGSAGPPEIITDDKGYPIGATFTTERKVDGEWKKMTATVWADELETIASSEFSKNMRKTWLGKCAEVASLRLGWPQELGGMYLRDELQPVIEREQRARPAQSAGQDGVDAPWMDEVPAVPVDA